METPRKISVFIASPGDLAEERAQFHAAVKDLNAGFADGADVVFEPLGWEDMWAIAGRRPQSVINTMVNRCDVFFLCLYRRWGQDAPDSKDSSYTEEEFNLAYDRFKRDREPEVFVFFKRVDPAQEGDPGAQLKKVMDFRLRLIERRDVIFRYIDDEPGAFKKEVDAHLRAVARGDIKRVDEQMDAMEKQSFGGEFEELKAQLKQSKKQSKKHLEAADSLRLTVAEAAAEAALDGRLEFARQMFAKATVESENTDVLFLASEFYLRIGNLDTAESMLERSLSISGQDSYSKDTARAYRKLGNIEWVRGDLNAAQSLCRRSLAIEERLGHRRGMADCYSNLGDHSQARNDLDSAETLFRKALGIYQALDNKEGVATQYGSLGTLYQLRGKLDRAERYFRGALEIDEAQGRQEGIANHFNNLGNLYYSQGALDKAEDLFQKSLTIDKAMGHQDGMGIQYQNLGIISENRGDFEGARNNWTRARDCYQVIGDYDMVAGFQSAIDDLDQKM